MLKKSMLISGFVVAILWVMQSFSQVIVQITPEQWQSNDWRVHHDEEWKHWHKHHHKEWQEWKNQGHHDHD